MWGNSRRWIITSKLNKYKEVKLRRSRKDEFKTERNINAKWYFHFSKKTKERFRFFFTCLFQFFSVIKLFFHSTHQKLVFSFFRWKRWAKKGLRARGKISNRPKKKIHNFFLSVILLRCSRWGRRKWWKLFFNFFNFFGEKESKQCEANDNAY